MTKKDKKSEGAVYASMLVGVLDAAAVFGADPEAIAQEAKIDPLMLRVPDALVPIAVYYRLCNVVSTHTRNPDLGLYIGRISYLESMHLMMYMASASRNLREWLNMMPSVPNMYGDVGVVKVRLEKNTFVLQWHPEVAPDPQRCGITDSILSAAVLQMGSFCVQPVKPSRIDLTYATPDSKTQLRSMLGDGLHFNQPVSALHYDRAALEYLLIHVSTRFYDGVAQQFAQVFSDDPEFTDPFFLSLHAAIRRQLPRGECSIELIASELNVSRRTLQRRLKAHDTNFQQLLQGIKSNLAKKYLADDRLTIIEIAFLLGYSGHSTFSAAFKTWNGMTPSDYRHL